MFSDLPVHLYDAYNGAVRATYRPFNGLDEMESPSVVEFSRDGQKILCGGFRTDRTIHIFDTATPGRDSTVLRLGKTRRSSDGQKGLVSSACFGGGGAGQQDLLAVGTYSPGSIYVYDFRAGQQPSGTIVSGLCVVGHGKGHSKKKRRFVSASFVDNTDTNECENEAQNDDNWFSAAKVKWFQSKAQGGVTQMMFAPNEDYTLYSASRRSNAVIAWDLRMLSCDPSHQSNPVRGLASFATVSDTNQRLEFDIDKSGEMLFVGCQDECVRVYNLKTGKILATFDGIGGVVNGVSHAFVDNRSLLTVAVGSRQFAPLDTLENDPSRTTFDTSGASCLRLMEITRSK